MADTVTALIAAPAPAPELAIRVPSGGCCAKYQPTSVAGSGTCQTRPTSLVGARPQPGGMRSSGGATTGRAPGGRLTPANSPRANRSPVAGFANLVNACGVTRRVAAGQLPAHARTDLPAIKTSAPMTAAPASVARVDMAGSPAGIADLRGGGGGGGRRRDPPVTAPRR